MEPFGAAWPSCSDRRSRAGRSDGSDATTTVTSKCAADGGSGYDVVAQHATLTLIKVGSIS